MSFLDNIIPNSLSDEKKGRLKEGLKQFNNDEIKSKNYTDFYSTKSYNFFLQGDLIKEFRFPIFNNNGDYDKRYYDTLIISNTCDIDINNKKTIPKNILIAKAIPFKDYINELKELKVKNINETINKIKGQHYTNLFYLPKTKIKKDYIVPLDFVSQISREELDVLKPKISENRIETLDYFGFYLFVFKLSYHFCRLPEVQYR